MTQPFPGTPGWELDQLARTFDEDWLDTWAHEYDAAEDVLDGCRPDHLAALLADLDDAALYERYREHIRSRAWALTSPAQVDELLAAVRACAAARLGGDETARLRPPDGLAVRPQEQRPDVPHPELAHLARYAHGLVTGDRRSPYLGDGPPDVVAATSYRVGQLGGLYLRRLLTEIAEARAQEHDPDGWLDLVEGLVRSRLGADGSGGGALGP